MEEPLAPAGAPIETAVPLPEAAPAVSEGAAPEAPSKRYVEDLDDDALAAHLDERGWDHTKFAKAQGYNQAVRGHLTEQNRRYQAEQQKAVAIATELEEFERNWAATPAETKIYLLESDPNAAAYAANLQRLKEYRDRPRVMAGAEYYADQTIGHLGAQLAQRPEFSHLTPARWAELTATDGPPGVERVAAFISTLVSEGMKAEKAKIPGMVKAALEKERSAYHLSGDEIDLVPTARENGAGSKARDEAIMERGGDPAAMAAAFKRLYGIDAPV